MICRCSKKFKLGEDDILYYFVKGKELIVVCDFDYYIRVFEECYLSIIGVYLGRDRIISCVCDCYYWLMMYIYFVERVRYFF